MSVVVRVPTALRTLTAGEAQVTVQGTSVAEVVASLEKKYPGIRGRLVDEHGDLRRFVNVYVGEEDIRFMEGIETSVPSGATVSIIPAVAGGDV